MSRARSSWSVAIILTFVFAICATPAAAAERPPKPKYLEAALLTYSRPVGLDYYDERAFWPQEFKPALGVPIVFWDRPDYSPPVVLDPGAPVVDAYCAYELRNVTAGWAVRIPCLADEVTAAVNGTEAQLLSFGPAKLEPDIAIPETAKYVTLPVGVSVPSSLHDGARAELFFHSGPNELEIRTLPRIDSPVVEASDPATISVDFAFRETESVLTLKPSPWGIRVKRATSVVGSGATAPNGSVVSALEGSKDGKRFVPIGQFYEMSMSHKRWAGFTGEQLGFNPLNNTVPKYSYDDYYYRETPLFRIGGSSLKPARDTVWYRHSYPAIATRSGNHFDVYAGSSTTVKYTPKRSPDVRIKWVYSSGAPNRQWLTGTMESAAARNGRLQIIYFNDEDKAIGSRTVSKFASAGGGRVKFKYEATVRAMRPKDRNHMSRLVEIRYTPERTYRPWAAVGEVYF